MFKVAKKCGLPEREREESQLIESGVHRFAQFKNNPDFKFMQIEVGKHLFLANTLCPRLEVNCGRDSPRILLGKLCRRPGVPPGSCVAIFAPCCCFDVLLDILAAGSQIQRSSPCLRSRQPYASSKGHFPSTKIIRGNWTHFIRTRGSFRSFQSQEPSVPS